MTDLRNPIFNNEDKARQHFESIRWPHGPFCPHCGNADPDQIHKIGGKSHRPGLYQCYECREHFTVTVGSVMERSKIPLTKWALAFHLMNSSKKGMSAHQLHRMLGVTYKTAWFMAHRIHEAMMDKKPVAPLGGSGKVVEADETYFGPKDHITTRTKKGKPGQHCSEAHLHRYLAEFEFRYNNRSGLGVEDTERIANAIRGAAGKRLYYQGPSEAANA